MKLLLTSLGLVLVVAALIMQSSDIREAQSNTKSAVAIAMEWEVTAEKWEAIAKRFEAVNARNEQTAMAANASLADCVNRR